MGKGLKNVSKPERVPVEKNDKTTPEVVQEKGFVLKKENYILLVVGFLLIIIGFFLMSGGGSDDPTVFSYDIFSWRRITLAPIIILLGFALEIFAIMWVPNKSKEAK